MGVVFFPSLPFMGVMLFPSFRLGNAPGGGSASLALLSLFFFYFSYSSSFLPLLFPFFPLLFSFLPLFFSFLPLLFSFSLLLFLLFLLHKNLSIPFLLLQLFHSIFLLCLLLPSPSHSRSFAQKSFHPISSSPANPLCLSPLSFASFSCSLLKKKKKKKGTARTVCFQDVADDVTFCNLMVIRL